MKFRYFYRSKWNAIEEIMNQKKIKLTYWNIVLICIDTEEIKLKVTEEIELKVKAQRS